MPPSPQVLIVGAGPAGLALAAELAGFGVSCQVVDKRTGRSRLSRACTVEPRTLELLDMRGRVGDLLAWGRECPHPPLGNEDGYLDYGLLDTPFPFSLSIPQARTEDALQAAAEKAGALLLPGTEMTGLSQDDDGVDVELTGPEGPATVRTRYVVGCDGVNSTVRDAVGVEFDGWNYDQSLMMADARLSSPPGPAEYARITRRGMAALFPFRDGTYRVIVLDREKFAVPADEPLTLEDLSESCGAILGSDIGIHDPLWLSRFRSSQRHAKRYRVGRVLLAGDAAHTHIPSGGQGLQTGIQDAFNLGWKLRAVLDGWAPQGLLDSYEAERYPIAAETLRKTDLSFRFETSDSLPSRVLRKAAMWSMRIKPVHRLNVLHLSGLTLRYPAEKRDRWTGRRVPDRPLVTAPGGPERLYELFRGGHFVLTGAEGCPPAAAGWEARLRTGVLAEPLGAGWPAHVLIRPDGYVAWAGVEPGRGLTRALRHWCGEPRTVAG
ncbi:FAD-dependent monooxygenase [Streptomyces sp. I5]|uniref:FAD-dependent monooxygenase n=1 Tax=Streptomyces sp. I5 TaxID=2759947 RepID=UPI0018EE8055|nr:FAD-dependent monooxygenase [Streptomyces sp. I5]MBJ6630431.1 FAD-dependent monooxygenase [Streptomyces sp. I5]